MDMKDSEKNGIIINVSAFISGFLFNILTSFNQSIEICPDNFCRTYGSMLSLSTVFWFLLFSVASVLQFYDEYYSPGYHKFASALFNISIFITLITVNLAIWHEKE